MVIPFLGLKNFRNYECLELSLEPRLNFFFGQNGQGKTNLIESLYLLTHLRSYRTPRIRPLMKKGHNQSRVSGVIEKFGVKHQVQLDLMGQHKRVFVDHKSLKYSSEYIQQFFSILFAPDLMGRFKEFPAERRGFFDRALCLLETGYFEKLKEFERIKAQKNKQLKGPYKNNLNVWNQMLSLIIPDLVKARKNLVADLNQKIEANYYLFGNKKEQLTLYYRADIDLMTADQVFQLLEQKKAQEQQQGFCVSGPHKDNYLMTMGPKMDRLGFSQGEYRIAFLSLLLSLNTTFHEKLNFKPILLFDDLFSELDVQTCSRLMQFLEGLQNQIFITLNEIPSAVSKKSSQFHVHQAQVTQTVSF